MDTSAPTELPAAPWLTRRRVATLIALTTWLLGVALLELSNPLSSRSGRVSEPSDLAAIVEQYRRPVGLAVLGLGPVIAALVAGGPWRVARGAIGTAIPVLVAVAGVAWIDSQEGLQPIGAGFFIIILVGVLAMATGLVLSLVTGAWSWLVPAFPMLVGLVAGVMSVGHLHLALLIVGAVHLVLQPREPMTVAF